jgi:hypothetical protein
MVLTVPIVAAGEVMQALGERERFASATAKGHPVEEDNFSGDGPSQVYL